MAWKRKKGEISECTNELYKIASGSQYSVSSSSGSRNNAEFVSYKCLSWTEFAIYYLLMEVTVKLDELYFICICNFSCRIYL